ncbi:Exonuclease [Aphis craccivora]|uniref:Exonuclease n=1 Tax=Aphis craccivora TaxID=307492 RepID=A0A6G0YSX6_APHCR|nr:Exonuclease [Aphis craccivora]
MWDIFNLDTPQSEILPSVSTVDNTVSHDNNIISTNTIIPEHGESSLEYSYSSNNRNSFSNPELSGFLSEFHFICEICHKEEVIRTEPFTELVPINLAIVASIVYNGQGYSNIEQFSASLNMPCMSNPTYQKLHEEACIVEYKTKKVLFIGVWNKYCTVCKKPETLNRPPTKHECFKNLSGTSTAMEADISKPYRNEITVKKIECTNHRLCFAVTKAIILFRKNMDLPQNKKVKLLKIDILNWPSHVFGFHDKCDRNQPILAWECIQKSLLPKKTKGDILKKQIVKLILEKLNKTDILKLERQTIDQSNNEEWKKERLCRSASNFGKICKMHKTTIRKNTVISILYQSYYIHGTTATSYGIQFESIAKPEFETMYNLKVLPASLFVDFNLSFLAASLDGLIENDAPDDAQKQNKLNPEVLS